MREKVIFELKSLYRDNMRVRAFDFGEGEPVACIIGATRGNEVQQLFICSQLVKTLKRLESEGKIVSGKRISVVPTLNNYSFNINKRFWPTDNTDINRMFPGYNLGETTQRIAAGVFGKIKDFEYGIQFASFYMEGQFTPHVRMMKTGYENIEMAADFGLPYTLLRKPKPYDTATLNYNWQIWNTHAFSLYTSTAEILDEKTATLAVEAVLNFLSVRGVLKGVETANQGSKVIEYDDLALIRSEKAGIFRRMVSLNQKVSKGECLAVITDPYTGEDIDKIISPSDAYVFFAHSKPLVYAKSVLFKMIPVKLL